MWLLLLREVDDCSRGKDDSNGESASWMSLLSPKSSTWHNEVVARFDETSVPPLAFLPSCCSKMNLTIAPSPSPLCYSLVLLLCLGFNASTRLEIIIILLESKIVHSETSFSNSRGRLRTTTTR